MHFAEIRTSDWFRFQGFNLLTGHQLGRTSFLIYKTPAFNGRRYRSPGEGLPGREHHHPNRSRNSR
jgi:hypothetical protein